MTPRVAIALAVISLGCIHAPARQSRGSDAETEGAQTEARPVARSRRHPREADQRASSEGGDSFWTGERDQEPRGPDDPCLARRLKVEPMPRALHPDLRIPAGATISELVGDRFVLLWWDTERLTGVLYDIPRGRWIPVASQGAPERGRCQGCRSFGAQVAGPLVLVFWQNPNVAPDPRGTAFDVARNEWRPFDLAGASVPRNADESVVVGRELVVFPQDVARFGFEVDFADGRALDLETLRWRRLAAKGAPSARSSAAVSVMGRKVLVWGGAEDAPPDARVHRNDGAVYDAEADAWRPISSPGAPAPRTFASVVPRAGRFLVFGGFSTPADARASGFRHANPEGAFYDPASDRWTPAPLDRGTPTDLLHYGARFGLLSPTSRWLLFLNRNGANPFGAILDADEGRWIPLVPPSPMPVGNRVVLGDDRVLFLEAPDHDTEPTAAVLDLPRNHWCTLPLPEAPMFARHLGVRSQYWWTFAYGRRVYVIGRTDTPLANCPAGAPCVPPPGPSARDDGVVLSW